MKRLLVFVFAVGLFLTNTAQSNAKMIWQSTTDGTQTYYIGFLSDGKIVYQSAEYDYIDDRKYSSVLGSVAEFKVLVAYMKKVIKTKEEIATHTYTIKKGDFGSAKLHILGIPRDYTFTKYALKLFEKELSKY